ncbi:DUF3293 domain-containing protein [Rhizobium sp. TRM95111]|uniref:DUF3293 domain-containing protein n=1 Tax=Rhizobium alarense TaxID=2846851 RepID=UPI001F421635|nr:DUF3293 domain-containing protein [Rhizobium alarense]MCF3641101.1 DUF3293 domain-containing protein [Rhizobium alarense]
MESLLDAYRRTRYVVETPDGEIVARIGEHSPGLETLMAQERTTTAAMITAWNPLSRPTPGGANRDANLRLAGDLRAHCAAVLPGRGEGTDGTWPPEASFLAIGIGRQAAEDLGRTYRQHAIVWFETGHPPELLPLSDEALAASRPEPSIP